MWAYHVGYQSLAFDTTNISNLFMIKRHSAFGLQRPHWRDIWCQNECQIESCYKYIMWSIVCISEKYCPGVAASMISILRTIWVWFQSLLGWSIRPFKYFQLRLEIPLRCLITLYQQSEICTEMINILCFYIEKRLSYST